MILLRFYDALLSIHFVDENYYKFKIITKRRRQKTKMLEKSSKWHLFITEEFTEADEGWNPPNELAIVLRQSKEIKRNVVPTLL